MVDSPVVTSAIRAELCPTGVLRAGFNMGNVLLVTGKTAEGYPIGVARDLAEAIAQQLGVSLGCVPFPRPAQVAEAADAGSWDICLIGAEPARAEKIAFTSAYVEIRARYLVHASSPLQESGEADRPGTTIVVKSGSAYELWLTRNIKSAELIRCETVDEALQRFSATESIVFAGLEEQLLADMGKVPGARFLEGMFTSVRQAVGTHKRNAAGARYLQEFVDFAKSSGLVASLIERHGVKGLSVAAA